MRPNITITSRQEREKPEPDKAKAQTLIVRKTEEWEAKGNTPQQIPSGVSGKPPIKLSKRQEAAKG